MPTLDDDEHFEAYLKEFRPLVPDVLPQPIQRSSPPRSAGWVWAVGFATVTVLAAISLQIFSSRIGQQGTAPASVKAVNPMQPLTIRNANAILAAAPSYNEAFERMSFHNQNSTIPKDKQSALAILAKEKIKL